MEILVEIGTSEQQRSINGEFKIIGKISNSLNPTLIEKIIVPCDFSKTVNQIQNISSFKSDRGQEQIVIAKTIELKNSCIFVFSPILYTGGWDNQTRMSIYLHETMHAINYRTFPKSIAKSPSYNRLFAHLYTLYDEYYANRKSFEIIDCVYPNKSKIFDDFIRGNFKSFLQSLNDDRHYEKIKSEINLFRIHGNKDLFLIKVPDIFDAAAKTIVYIYSYIDHFDFVKNQKNLINKSNFINKKTKSLIDFFRSKYLKDEIDLLSGINLMEDFLTNFGMRFEDRESGEDCCVLDI